MKANVCLVSAALALATLSSLEAGEKKVLIGSAVDQFTFTDIHYLPRTFSDLGEAKAYVIVFTTTACPLAQRYLPRLQELSSEYGAKGVRFLSLNVGPEDSVKEIAYQAIEQKVEFPFGKDFNGQCARALGASRTPEVVVLDASRKIRYRGRIDNQYRLGGVKPSADRQDLKEAIDDVLAGRKVRVKETPVDGCVITFPATPTADPSLTYAKDVAPIINKHCVECHRPGTEAPFTLLSYEKVAAKAGTIAEVVEEQRMPPWFAHPGFGRFINDRSLTPEERSTLIQWARGGRAPGDLAQAPKPPQFPESKWLIGEPDLIITAAKPETLPATGYIPYRYVVLPYTFPHDTWVQGVQIMPSNPRVVHHANLALVSLTQGYDSDRNFITGKVPGGLNVDLDSGMAMMLPKGMGLVFQIHYVTTGKEETDQISVGLRYAREPIHKRVRYKIIGDYKFRIPPDAPAWPVTAQKELECDATGIALFSHMHLRGKDTTFFAHYPDGKTETLLALPNYSFDWQLSYVWPRGEQHFPKGTKIECSSHFDNSRFNPYNPNPSATVTNGPQTHDEMMQGFLFYTDDAEHLDIRVDPKTGKEIPQEQTRADSR
jgi:thiol-disulfide isomerase/thioredoxin/mono/diheme cytochrome c family protein